MPLVPLQRMLDKARSDGDETKARQFEETAQALANQLVNAESSVEDLKNLHDQSLQAASWRHSRTLTHASMIRHLRAPRRNRCAA